MSAVTTETLTPEKALELLRKARDLKGADYVYPPAEMGKPCTYREEDGSPSCIAGHVFMWAGVQEMEEGKAASTIADALGLPEVVGNILDAAQESQDLGAPWGEAVEEAEQVAHKYGVNA